MRFAGRIAPGRGVGAFRTGQNLAASVESGTNPLPGGPPSARLPLDDLFFGRAEALSDAFPALFFGAAAECALAAESCAYPGTPPAASPAPATRATKVRERTLESDMYPTGERTLESNMK